MKKSILIPMLAAGLLCAFHGTEVRAQSIESMPPVVVKTVPEAGLKNVEPGETEIKVTFSKPMMNGSWTWSSAWQDSTPESVSKPSYSADGKTCTLKVKLEAGKTYGYWLNSNNFHNFKDRQGHPSIPYLLVFKTKSE